MKSYLCEERCYKQVHGDGLPFYQRKAADPCGPDLERLFAWEGFPQSGARLLELGCGDAFVTGVLARRGLVVTGVDCSPTAIMHGRQNLAAAGLEAVLHVGDVYDMDCARGGEFPFVLDSHCFHCVTDYGERAAFLAECRRVLQPTGSLFLASMAEQSMDWTKSVENLPWQRKYDVDEKGCYCESLVPPGSQERVKSRLFVREEVLRRELETAGLRIVQFERFAPDGDPDDLTFLVQARPDIR